MSTFVFDKRKVSIQGLFITSYDETSNSNPESATVYANDAMQARLILEYTYDESDGSVPDEVVRPEVERYLRESGELIVYEQSRAPEPIEGYGWRTEWQDNGFLHDLLRPSRAAEGAGSEKPPRAHRRGPRRADRTGATRRSVYGTFVRYVVPPLSLYGVTCSLRAKFTPMVDGKPGPHADTTDPVQLAIEPFSITADDLQFEYLYCVEEVEEGNKNRICRLFALRYKNDALAPAQLSRITSHKGLVLRNASLPAASAPNLGITMMKADDAKLSAWYYVDGDSANTRRHPLIAGKQDTSFSVSAYGISNKSPSTCKGFAWSWPEQLTEAEVNHAFTRGIPTIAVMRNEQIKLIPDKGDRWIFNMKDTDFLAVDTCGGVIAFQVDWKPRDWDNNHTNPFQIQIARFAPVTRSAT